MIDLRSRRQILCGLGAVGTAELLAGCSDGRTGDGNTTGAEDDTTTTHSEDQATDEPADDTRSESGGSETGNEDDLDLAEANVVDVAVEATSSDNRYEFAVTLHHNDGDEDGYANWWQVEGLDGQRLGRRELTHAHSQQPFTRSATIEVSSRSCVVVRGHDQVHGYGGQAVLLNLDSKATSAISQGVKPQGVDDVDCPSG